MHCLFRHLLPPEGAVRPLWDLACDMSAEYLRTDFFPAQDGKLTRLRVADALTEVFALFRRLLSKKKTLMR